MDGTFINAHLVDAILVLVGIEALALAALPSRIGMRIRPARILPTLLSGAFLLFALRAALVGAGANWIAISLLGALIAHAVDLVVRLRD